METGQVECRYPHEYPLLPLFANAMDVHYCVIKTLKIQFRSSLIVEIIKIYMYTQKPTKVQLLLQRLLHTIFIFFGGQNCTQIDH